MVKLSQTDPILKDCLEETYQTDDLVGMIVKMWNDHPSEAFSKLRENEEYRELFDK